MKQLLNEAEYDMRNYEDRGECYLPDNRLQDLYTTSHHTKSKFNNCFIIHSNNQACLFVDFFQDFVLFLGTISGYITMTVLADSPQHVDNIHRSMFCVFLQFFSYVLVRNHWLFRLRITESAMFFSSLCGSRLTSLTRV